MQFLLNNSITIIFLLTLGIVGYSEYRRYLQRNNLSSEEFLARVRARINEVGSSLIPKLATSLVVATIISMVSFRELFINDVFHIVFLTMLLAKPANDQLQKLFK